MSSTALRRQGWVKVEPMRVVTFNQIDFPVTFPLLDLPFPDQRCLKAFMSFEPHETGPLSAPSTTEPAQRPLRPSRVPPGSLSRSFAELRRKFRADAPGCHDILPQLGPARRWTST